MGHSPEKGLDDEPAIGSEEWRAASDRKRSESRARYHARLVDRLAQQDLPADPVVVADVVFDELFVHCDVNTGTGCACSCHPKLPSGDLHDSGFACVCQQTVEERRRSWDEWFRAAEEHDASPAGVAARHAREAKEAELQARIVALSGVTVSEHGGWAPEQWRGTVDGHSFYFRERDGEWRIELDLRPSGRFYQQLVGEGADAHLEQRETHNGDVIARGTDDDDGYGHTEIERLGFIVGRIRDHLRRVTCTVHDQERADIELFCGRRLNWCPACGTALHGGEPEDW